MDNFILITIISVITLSFASLLHLMVYKRKKITIKELNLWFVILIGLPVIGALLYIGYLMISNSKDI